MGTWHQTVIYSRPEEMFHRKRQNFMYARHLFDAMLLLRPHRQQRNFGDIRSSAAGGEEDSAHQERISAGSTHNKAVVRSGLELL